MNEIDNNIEFTSGNETDKPIDIEYIVSYWITMSDNDYDTLMDLYKVKRNNWALFIGHLVIEKLLKATFVKQNKKHPPLIHDLLKIAMKENLALDNEQKLILDSISSFNINARYDNYKLEFYKKCSNEYTNEWIEKIINLRLWIKQQHLM